MNATPSPRPLPEPRDVRLSLPAAELEGSLALPDGARGLVLFAHGSGSSRHSPRNRYVAEILQAAGLGTLLMDLLTREEDEVDRFTRQFRFDIGLLADRLTGAIDWLEPQTETRDLPIGLFGASTGAAAALRAAAARPDCVRAVVSRGGRPDLAGEALERVRAARGGRRGRPRARRRPPRRRDRRARRLRGGAAAWLSGRCACAPSIPTS